jgi:hypothetical protein
VTKHITLWLIGLTTLLAAHKTAGTPAALAADPPSAEEPAEEAALRAAIEKSLPLLTKGAVGHRENRTCFACHNQGVPLFAITAARRRGFAIDAQELDKQLSFIAKFLESNRERYLEGKGQGGQVDTAGYALATLAAGGWNSDETTAAVTEYLLKYQQERPYWRTTSNRPPSEASLFTTNYLALAGLKHFGTCEQQERIAERTEQVRSWLSEAEPKDHEDRVFRLWALKTIDAPAEQLEAAAELIQNKQRSDGGWSQLDADEPAMATQSDAYATGTALVALCLAGEVPTCDPAYQRGVRYLLETQREDGSWHVTSRSKPFQTYFETGFPHGADQFISAAASGWATWALIEAVDREGRSPAEQHERRIE